MVSTYQVHSLMQALTPEFIESTMVFRLWHMLTYKQLLLTMVDSCIFWVWRLSKLCFWSYHIYRVFTFWAMLPSNDLWLKQVTIEFFYSLCCIHIPSMRLNQHVLSELECLQVKNPHTHIHMCMHTHTHTPHAITITNIPFGFNKESRTSQTQLRGIPTQYRER